MEKEKVKKGLAYLPDPATTRKLRTRGKQRNLLERKKEGDCASTLGKKLPQKEESSAQLSPAKERKRRSRR